MLSKKTAGGRSSLARTWSSTKNLQSHLGRVTPILTQWSSVLQDDEIYDESDHKDKENTADMEDNQSDSLCNNLNEPEATTQSKIKSMWKMMDEQHEMLHDAIQQNTELCAENAKLMEATRESSRESIWPEATKTRILNMTYSEWSHCGSNKLDNFLVMIRSNFQFYARLFPHGDPDKVKYGASLLNTWNNTLDPAQRWTQMPYLVEWLRDQQRNLDPCSQDFEAYLDEMQKMYSDMDRILNGVNFLQEANETVRVYANWIKANWRAAGWLQQDNKNLYEISWSGLWPGHKSNIKLLTLKNGIIDSMDELFDCAADLEVKPDCKKPQHQQSHQQQKQ